MNSINFSDFAKNTLSTYLLDKLGIDKLKAVSKLGKEIEEDFNSLNNTKTKESRQQNFAIKGTIAADYTEHYIELSVDKAIICGIRHLGGNVEKPFVYIQRNFSCSKQELLVIYKQHLAVHFTIFKPIYLNYFSKTKASQNQIGLCYMAQKAEIIKQLLAFETESLLMLESPKDEMYYEWYKQSYAAFHANNDKLKDNVPCNSLEEMEESRTQGLLKQVYYSGELIGVIAALPEDFLAKKGIYFIEIHIKHSFQGKGLAKAIQRKFIAEVANDNCIVWGTIDMTNLPSLKTARSLKRLPVRYENFIELV